MEEIPDEKCRLIGEKYENVVSGMGVLTHVSVKRVRRLKNSACKGVLSCVILNQILNVVGKFSVRFVNESLVVASSRCIPSCL